MICVKCTAEGQKAAQSAPLAEANEMFELQRLNDEKILTWDPSSPMHDFVKSRMEEEQSAEMQRVHDKLKYHYHLNRFIMLRTQDIGALVWTAGLAGTVAARYRCARLAMMVVLYATNRGLRPCGTEAHKEHMRAARSVSSAPT